MLSTEPHAPASPAAAIRAAAVLEFVDLSYVSQDDPGIARKSTGRGFRYVRPDGGRVEDDETLSRIRALAIPPAWTAVWIALDPAGHIQATGRDAKARKQYIYHSEFRAFRDRTKFEHVIDFVEALPALRARIAADMAAPGLGHDKVLATVVALLERTLIRVGNETYARDNGSYGLTTMRDPHVKVEGSRMRFLFKGKSGKEWNLELRDRRLAKLVRACQDIPGQKLFQYRAEDGSRHSVTSADLNAYLREVSGGDITAKDFRTWAGTVMAAVTLRDLSAAEDALPLKKRLRKAVEMVASRLGNTPTVCRQCYIHPAVYACFEHGEGLPRRGPVRPVDGLSDDEVRVLAFLKRELRAAKAAA